MYFVLCNRKKTHRPHFIKLKSNQKKALWTPVIIKWSQIAPKHHHLFLNVKHIKIDWTLLRYGYASLSCLQNEKDQACPLSWEWSFRCCSQNRWSRNCWRSGVDAIINRLNHLFKKHSTITKYQAFESFMTVKKDHLPSPSRHFLMNLTNVY